MDRFERVKAKFSGKSTDRPVYAVWKHFPNEDRTPQGFTRAHLTFQDLYDPDLLKLSPHGRYCTADWGCEIGPIHPVYGSTSALSFPIKLATDFEDLRKLDPLSGEFGLQVKGVKEVSQHLSSRVPLMMTIFSPFMVASELDPEILTHVKTALEHVEVGVQIITEVMIEFSQAVLDAGSHGLFIASQHSRLDVLSDRLFQNLEVKYTKKLIDAVRSKSDFIVFHIHGDNPRFKDISNNYAVDAINWHSQTTSPSLKQAERMTDKALLGGIEESHILRKGTQHEIKTNVETVLESGIPRLILAPGCVIPIDTPPENLQYLVDLIRS